MPEPEDPDPAAEPEEAATVGLTGIDIESALQGFGFPGGPRDLAEKARENGADEAVVERLAGLPQRSYTSLGDALRALDMLS